MSEAAEIKTAANPHEVLLVADSLTGQDAVNLARSFDERVGLTGIVLTRVDGDGRGGAALSMRAVTGKPIKLIAPVKRPTRWKIFIRAASRGGSSAWATWCRWSKRPPLISTRKSRAYRRADAQGPVRPHRHARAIDADGEYGRHQRADGHDARHRQDEKPDRQLPGSTTDF